jgi:hypothetical protein
LGGRAALARDTDPQALMLDFDLAQVVMGGDLRQSRNDGKIDAAGRRLAGRFGRFSLQLLHFFPSLLTPAGISAGVTASLAGLVRSPDMREGLATCLSV